MSTPVAPEAKRARLHALDGLRGVAAVAVFFFHSSLLDPLPEAVRSAILVSPLGALFNGPGAVHVFFVLSGYVLALTLGEDAGRGRLPRYYVRRVFRIHPPYVAAVLFAFAASMAVTRLLEGVVDVRWGIPASKLPIALSFPSMAFGLLPVGWSLFVEGAMSLLFPLLVWLARSLHPSVPLLLSGLFLAELDPRLGFLRFTVDFALGLFLRLEQESIARRLRALPGWVPGVAALAGLVLLQAPITGAVLTTGVVRLEHGHSPLAVALFAVSAGLLVFGALHSPALDRALTRPIARWFGRVSYSFYLVHLTVITAVGWFAHAWVGTWAFALAGTAVAFALSAAVSELGWRLVEAPAIRAGRAVIRLGERAFAAAGSR